MRDTRVAGAPSSDDRLLADLDRIADGCSRDLFDAFLEAFVDELIEDELDAMFPPAAGLQR